MDILNFVKKYHSEKECENFLIENRFKDGESCTYCNNNKIYKVNRNRKYQYFKCSSCKREFTILTNTVFHGTKAPLDKWFLAMHLLTQSSKGIASTQLAGQIGVTQRTAWHLLTRLRIFTTHSSTHFTGTIEADETFVGGLEKNKYLSEKRGELVRNL